MDGALVLFNGTASDQGFQSIDGQWGPKVNFIVDMVFIFIYAIEIVVYFWLTTIGLVRRPETRTIFNVVLSASIYMCLATHIACLSKSEIDHNVEFKTISLQYYLYY